MTLRDYWRILKQRWRFVAVVMTIAIGLSLVLAFATPPTYQSRVQVFVTSNSTSSDQYQQFSAAAFAQAQVSTYAAIVTAPQVLDAVTRQLSLTTTEADLKSKISATAPSQQTLINIYVRDGNAQDAADIANATATAFIAMVQKYATPTGTDRPAVRMFITDPATAPPTPLSPKPVLDVAIGIFFGLLVGASSALIRDTLDTRVRSVEKIAELIDVPVMGVVVDDKAAEASPIATTAGRQSVRAENFRHLRANLQFAQIDGQQRVIAVTSAVPGEGKTTVALNIANTLAEAGFRVCLVDADLRRSKVAEKLGLVGSVGLTSLFLQRIPLADALQSAGPNLSVLAAGPKPPNPSELLASELFSGVINALTSQFDYIIVDTAPVLPVADGAEVASLADGTLVVARYNKTTDNQVRRTAEALRRVDATILGIVLNRLPQKAGTEYDYAYHYEDEPESSGLRLPLSARSFRGAGKATDAASEDAETPAARP